MLINFIRIRIFLFTFLLVPSFSYPLLASEPGDLLWTYTLEGDFYGMPLVKTDPETNEILLWFGTHLEGASFYHGIDRGNAFELVWKQDYDLSVESAMALDGDHLIANTLVASDTSTGNVTQTKAYAGVITLLAETGELICYNLETRTSDSSPALDTQTGLVYATYVVNPTDGFSDEEGGLLQQINPDNCQTLNSYVLDGWAFFAPMVFNKKRFEYYQLLYPLDSVFNSINPALLTDRLIAGSSIYGTEGTAFGGFGGEGRYYGFSLDDLSLDFSGTFDNPVDRNGSFVPLPEGEIGIIIGNQAGEVLLMNSTTGEIYWTFDSQSENFASMVMGHQNSRLIINTGIGINDYQQKLLALDTFTGEFLWSVSAYGGESTPVVGITSDGISIVYAMSDPTAATPSVIAIKESTGELLWSKELIDQTGIPHEFRQASLNLSEQGILYVGTVGIDGEEGGTSALFAFKTESSGLDPTSWCPKYRCTPDNTGEPYFISSTIPIIPTTPPTNEPEEENSGNDDDDSNNLPATGSCQFHPSQ